MKRKLILLLIILIAFITILFYFKPIEVNDIVEINSSSLQKMKASIYFSSYSYKEFEVTGERSMGEIFSIIESIQMRNVLIAPDGYTPKFKDTYRFTLASQNNKVININLLNNKFIEIDRKVYKIINRQELSKLYEIIILDQNRETLDEFYYNQINKN